MTPRIPRTEKLSSDLLWYGTWIAVVAVAAGLSVGLDRPLGFGIAQFGIAVFILLPISRVALLLAIFLKEKDRVYVTMAASVLAIIAISVIVGFYGAALHFQR
ncbi:MAG TPA: DUF1634 domain-containing protein [Pseudobdellovibrionaceae bacterium]|nr:DUF1634 domain-containing protein [Pseudobdellovibrionaceae bacterium]